MEEEKAVGIVVFLVFVLLAAGIARLLTSLYKDIREVSQNTFSVFWASFFVILSITAILLAREADSQNEIEMVRRLMISATIVAVFYGIKKMINPTIKPPSL